LFTTRLSLRASSTYSPLRARIRYQARLFLSLRFAGLRGAPTRPSLLRHLWLNPAGSFESPTTSSENASRITESPDCFSGAHSDSICVLLTEPSIPEKLIRRGADSCSIVSVKRSLRAWWFWRCTLRKRCHSAQRNARPG